MMADPSTKSTTAKPAEPSMPTHIPVVPPWQEPPGSVPEPPQAAPHLPPEVPPWQEPPEDPEFETVHVLTGEFAGREMRFPKDVAASALSGGWAKRIGDPDPQLDVEAQMKARNASHEAIIKLRQKREKELQEPHRKQHQTREMQSGKSSEEPYRTRQSGSTSSPPPKR
jgi:hypothetical protein